MYVSVVYWFTLDYRSNQMQHIAQSELSETRYNIVIYFAFLQHNVFGSKLINRKLHGSSNSTDSNNVALL